MKKFKALIFDIGDVIIDIDYLVVISEFQKLASVDFGQIISYTKQNRLFDLFETGKISAPDFVLQIRMFLKPGVSDADIIKAWNSILIHYPPQKIELLKQLKKQNLVLALSNINEIHVDALNKAAQEKFSTEKFSDFFHRAYYSNEVGYRKPEKEIYQMVLQKENLIPEETFFVDDKIENIEVARELGIQAHQLTNRNNLEQLLIENGILQP